MKQSAIVAGIVILFTFSGWSVGQTAGTQPATAPSTVPSTRSSGSMPTPAELFQKMKAQRDAHSRLAKVGHIELNEPIIEKPAEFSLFGDNDQLTLHSLLTRLHEAQDDDELQALLITIGQTDLNYAQAQEVASAIEQVRARGKKVFVYADSYETVSYSMAASASDVCMLEGGEIIMPGVSIEAIFAKGLLDKVGVKADMIQIGEYKGADEQYTRTEATPQLREEMNRLVDALYGQIVDSISTRRKLKQDRVTAAIDQAILSGKTAKEMGLVDHLVDSEGLRDLLAKKLGRKVRIVQDYGESPREAVDLSSPFTFFARLNRKRPVSDKPAVAIIYAQGVIIDGYAEEGLFGGGDNVGSDNMRQALRMAARDPNVKAVVVRIDSPGGSALASEAIWQSMRRFCEEKPLIISIGSMAASGGYYMASAGDWIVADPSAIIGSIGVVGGKFVLGDLFGKIGLSTESFSRGQNADLFSSTRPFDERQRQLLTRWMQETYNQFTQRVMANRSDRIKDIDQVARGRVFSAVRAKELGMVDALGGVEDAIVYAAAEAELDAGEYEVRVLPPTRTLADILRGPAEGPEASTPLRPTIQIAPDSLLKALPAPAQRALGQQLQILQMLQDRPVMLVTPYVIRVR